MSVVRLAQKAASNCLCASVHAFAAVRKRATPASVRRSALLRRSRLPFSTAMRPSRSNGRIFRPRVVRSTTRPAAKALIVIGPSRRSLASIENYVVRSPLAARNRS